MNRNLNEDLSVSDNVENDHWNPLKLMSDNTEVFSSQIDKIRTAMVVAVAELYLLLFSIHTSPLYEIWGGDSAFYILVGKGMKYGYFPYRDFYDTKGPYMYILEYIGQVICEGRFGAFIIQSVLFCLSMVFLDKVIGVGRTKRKLYEVVLIFPLVLMAIFSVGGGGLTEDFSLLPLSVCLYLCTKFVNSSMKKHPPIWGGISGLSFGILALMRVNNSAALCAGVLTISIILIYRHQWKNILCNAIAFLGGCLLAALPIIILLGHNHTLVDMINQVFLGGWKYSQQVKNNGLLLVFNGAYRVSVYPLCVGLLVSLMFATKDTWRSTLLIWISTIATLMSIAVSGRNFEHYYVLLIPVVSLDVWYIWNMVMNGQIKERKKHVAVVFATLFCLSFFGIIYLDGSYIEKKCNY